MSFKIGDKVTPRSSKDLYCEFGKEYRQKFFGVVGVIDKTDSHGYIHVQYKGIDGVINGWWYFPAFLERVKSDEI